MQFLIIALIAFLIEWMYLFLVHKLFDGISRVIDACKYLTPSNQESRYITEVELMLLHIITQILNRIWNYKRCCTCRTCQAMAIQKYYSKNVVCAALFLDNVFTSCAPSGGQF